MEALFVYGTLMDPDVQKDVFGRISGMTRDVLEGYALSETTIDDTYPIIAPEEGSAVNGQVLSVSSEELELIDEYETDAYARRKVCLKSGREAWVYTS